MRHPTLYRHSERLAMASRNLRLCADSLDNALEPRHITSVIQTLQTCISLLGLCLFAKQQETIQNAKHDIDAWEAH